MKIKPTIWVLSVLLGGMAWPAGAPSAQANDPAGSSGCVDDTWVATSRVGAPSPRSWHTAVWTGTEMLVWGGRNFGLSVNTGGRYDPATGTWMAISTDGAPSARAYHTAMWTDTEIIVWGGCADLNCRQPLNTGGRYDPETGTWATTSSDGAPSARGNHTAVWTGTEMLVWGGFPTTDTGGRYDPVTDTWTAISTDGAPSARRFHAAVWTGMAMLVWGGEGGGWLNTGGQYDPATDTWTATSTVDAPSARAVHTAVWTDTEMLVWGGCSGPDCSQYPNQRLNTGGRYDPATDTWTATSTVDAPSARSGHAAVWTGTEMLVWGGAGGSCSYLNTGGRYDPASDTWVPTTTVNTPSPRYQHTAVWTGKEMLVWGGVGGGGLQCIRTVLDTGGRYCASTGREGRPER